MASTSIKQLLCRFLLLSLVSPLGTYAATNCQNETTINGQPFPRLIEVTTEDLISGLERGLFTSVDLVNVFSNGHCNNVILPDIESRHISPGSQRSMAHCTWSQKPIRMLCRSQRRSMLKERTEQIEGQSTMATNATQLLTASTVAHFTAFPF